MPKIKNNKPGFLQQLLFTLGTFNRTAFLRKPSNSVFFAELWLRLRCSVYVRGEFIINVSPHSQVRHISRFPDGRYVL